MVDIARGSDRQRRDRYARRKANFDPAQSFPDLPSEFLAISLRF
jgi:hypothetical protein